MLSGSPYSFVRTLGEGRSGVVVEAAHRESHRRVALKLFAPLEDGAVDRLLAGYAALAPLAHPHLAKLHELTRFEDRACLVMELIEGVEVIRYLRPEVSVEGAAVERGMLFGQIVQPLGESAFTEKREAMDRLQRVFAQIAGGLSSLHALGHVHGDLRPSNILVEASGRAVLIDLLSEHDPSDPARFAGTAAYMAPEHGLGRPTTAACDLYSLGVLLFEALTGELPFMGSGREIFVRKNTVSAPRPGLLVPHVPSVLDDVCARLLDRRPAARPSATEVAALLA